MSEPSLTSAGVEGRARGDVLDRDRLRVFDALAAVIVTHLALDRLRAVVARWGAVRGRVAVGAPGGAAVAAEAVLIRVGAARVLHAREREVDVRALVDSAGALKSAKTSRLIAPKPAQKVVAFPPPGDARDGGADSENRRRFRRRRGRRHKIRSSPRASGPDRTRFESARTHPREPRRRRRRTRLRLPPARRAPRFRAAAGPRRWGESTTISSSERTLRARPPRRPRSTSLACQWPESQR
jgi:hypothetical protein